MVKMVVGLVCTTTNNNNNNNTSSNGSTSSQYQQQPQQTAKKELTSMALFNQKFRFDLKGIPINQCWSIVSREQFNWTNKPFHSTFFSSSSSFRFLTLEIATTWEVCVCWVCVRTRELFFFILFYLYSFFFGCFDICTALTVVQFHHFFFVSCRCVIIIIIISIWFLFFLNIFIELLHVSF